VLEGAGTITIDSQPHAVRKGQTVPLCMCSVQDDMCDAATYPYSSESDQDELDVEEQPAAVQNIQVIDVAALVGRGGLAHRPQPRPVWYGNPSLAEGSPHRTGVKPITFGVDATGTLAVPSKQLLPLRGGPLADIKG